MDFGNSGIRDLGKSFRWISGNLDLGNSGDSTEKNRKDVHLHKWYGIFRTIRTGGTKEQQQYKTVKDIDSKKLYIALMKAKIQGEFTAYTITEGRLVDVENFPQFSTEAIVKYRWYQDERNYVEIYTENKVFFDVVLRIDDFNLPYNYNNGQITIQKNFICPTNRRKTARGILEVLATAFESAKSEENKE